MHGLLREQGWEVDPFGKLRRILPNWQPISPRQPFGLPDPWWYENIPKIEYKQCRRKLLPYIDQVAEEALVFFRVRYLLSGCRWLLRQTGNVDI